MLVPVCWSFERNSVLPLVDVKAECQEKASEAYIIRKAVEIIEQANEFKGIPCPRQFRPSKEAAITVRFTLIFPNDNDMSKFMETIRQWK